MSAEKGFREMVIETGFQEAALLWVGHHGRGNNLGSGMEVRKHIASQESVSSWCGIHGGNTRGLEVAPAHSVRPHT